MNRFSVAGKYLRWLFPLLLFPPFPVTAQELSLAEQIHILAVAGDPEAQFSLAMMYDFGEQGKTNPGKAVHWYQQAAHQGLPAACLYLGMKYENGNGVQRDIRLARHWYTRAATQGLPTAQFLLGNLELATSKKLGLTWIRKAAGQGYPPALQFLENLRPIHAPED